MTGRDREGRQHLQAARQSGCTAGGDEFGGMHGLWKIGIEGQHRRGAAQPAFVIDSQRRGTTLKEPAGRGQRHAGANARQRALHRRVVTLQVMDVSGGDREHALCAGQLGQSACQRHVAPLQVALQLDNDVIAA